ncbi:unnamed protein product [Bursaphelenchus xylophilus]|uniref:(pine wood nematode) hypothetical protein n=1 Tax=Bursaphelenchus xylophilus TaxID=6326 RepID=A0A1I7RSZ2_BURXY|nr:unnamed protein product [Bursaphelenchus xylophilus]CAG9122723.1 unnamed protein product [Bursaphelenchus xylophilus]
MSFFKLNQVANNVVSTASTIPAFTAAYQPRPIVYSDDTSMQRVPLRAATQTARYVSTIPKPTTPKPTLEEFDPLNPGGWQLGAGGKILPRLPEGTRCGKLVMGKYGLYDPKLRRQVEEFAAGLEAGNKSEEATPVHAKHAKISKFMSHVVFLLGIYNLITLVYGKPIWPYHNHKIPGSA